MAMNGVVSWAGPDPAPIWLDSAREYTERWLHQQQIRDAVNKPGLKEKRFFHPVLDTFVRALPHTYKDVPVADTAVRHIACTRGGGEAWDLGEETERRAPDTGGQMHQHVMLTKDQE